jgi:hypothetical protein
MPSPGDPSRYRAWLLRCWRERDPDPARSGPWRCSLEDPHTGERRGFATLTALVDFLERTLAGAAAGPAGEGGAPDVRS